MGEVGANCCLPCLSHVNFQGKVYYQRRTSVLRGVTVSAKLVFSLFSSHIWQPWRHLMNIVAINTLGK